MHQISELIALFNRLFEQDFSTRLVAGDDEPVYLPADENETFNRVIFAHGFFSSAMHEISHWCIAGEERRKQVDYGYWYNPDGRTLEQQETFALVEAKPQALEWIFSKSAGAPFVVSLDNLNGEAGDALPFKKAIIKEIENYRASGLNARSNTFQKALAVFYDQPEDWRSYSFELSEL